MKNVVLGALSLLIGSAVSAQDTDADNKKIYINGELVDFGFSKTIHTTWGDDDDSYIAFSIRENEIEFWSTEKDNTITDWNRFYQDAIDFHHRIQGSKHNIEGYFSSKAGKGQYVGGSCVKAGESIRREAKTCLDVKMSIHYAGDEIIMKAPIISVDKFFTKTQEKVLFLNSDNSTSWLRGFYYQPSALRTSFYDLGFSGFIDFTKPSTIEQEDSTDSPDLFFAFGTGSVTFILENPNI